MKLLCGFHIGGFYFSVPIDRVQEVLKKAPVTPVPGAPRAVAGLLNLRGAIVTVLDIRPHLGVSIGGPAEAGAHLLLRDGSEIVALRIDRIGEVVNVSEESFEPPPDTLRGPARALITGVYKLPDRLMLALDLDVALNTDDVPSEGKPA